MRLNKIDKALDNPKYKESKKFKKGGFFATKKTVNFGPGNKRKGEREVEFFDDD